MDDQQLLRYSRQIMLPQLDYAGQQRLLESSVLVVGLGGLGSPVAMYLATAGVGHLLLNDFDDVDLSNLQRQIAHSAERLGENKANSAAQCLQALNSDCRVIELAEKLDAEALLKTVVQVDVVVDCSDNFATRFLLNRLCVQASKPLVSGAAIRFEGQVSVFRNRQSDDACYRCLYDDEAADDAVLNCSENGVLAPVVGVIGSLQAVEVIKVLTDIGEPLVNRLLVVDALNMDIRTLTIRKDQQCPVCA